MGLTERTEERLRIRHAPGRGAAILLGIVVSILWASSVILIRLGLNEEVTDPIGFAGIRFSLAAILLFPLALPRLRAAAMSRVEPRSMLGVVLYGGLMFGVTQIAVHVALGTVPASTMGLMIGLTPVVTALLMLRGRRERASLLQLIGIAILVAGVVVYFGLDMPEAEMLPSLLLAAVVPVAVGAAAVLGRRLAVDVDRYGGPLGLTAIAMLAGGLFTLVVALVVEGTPDLSARAWLLILWMAGVNTALAYTLWTQVQRTLIAVESSVLGDVTVLVTAFFGWLVLGEALGVVEVVGLVVAVVGVAMVQLAPLVQTRRNA